MNKCSGGVFKFLPETYHISQWHYVNHRSYKIESTCLPVEWINSFLSRVLNASMVLVLIKVPCSGNVLRGTRLSLKNDNKLSIIEIRKSTLNKCIIWSNPKIKFAFISSHYWEGERESKMD